MSCLEGLVRQRIAEGQPALKRALRDPLLSGMMLGFLPQTWAILTEQESLVLHTDEDGTITVKQGTTPVMDGSIAMRHDVLAESLRTGGTLPTGAYQAIFYTDRGKMAFRQMATFFGL